MVWYNFGMSSAAKLIFSLVTGAAVGVATGYKLRNFKVNYSGDPNSKPFGSILKEESVRLGVPFIVGTGAYEGTTYLLDKFFPEKEQKSSEKENWTERVMPLISGSAVFAVGAYLLRNFNVSYSGDLKPKPLSFYLKEKGVRLGVPFIAGTATYVGTAYLLDRHSPEKEGESLPQGNWTAHVTASKKPSGLASSHALGQTSPSL